MGRCAWCLWVVIAGCHRTPGSGAPDAAQRADAPDAPPARVACPAPASGPLCGPPDRPCRIAASEPITQPWAASAQLLLDCDDAPAVLYAAGATSLSGAIARRGDGWTPRPTPIDAAMIGGAFDRDGAVRALVYTSPYVVTPAVFAQDAWTTAAPLDGKRVLLGSGTAVAIAPDATYALLIDDVGGMDLARGGATWTYAPLDGDADTNGAIAVAPDGAIELAYWGTGGTSHWELIYQAPPAPPEIVTTIGSVLLAEHLSLAAAVDQPRLLFDVATPGFESSPGTSELDYATRDAAGTWSVATVATDEHSTRCYMPPPQPGVTCSEHDVVHAPVAALADTAGDARLIYRLDDTTVDMVSQCMTGYCWWSVTGESASSDLVIAWPDGAGFASATLLDGAPVSAAADSRGQIHVLMAGDPARYLVLAP
jgi:hypothetical protein